MGSVLFALMVCSGVLYIGYRIFRHTPSKVLEKSRWYDIGEEQRN